MVCTNLPDYCNFFGIEYCAHPAFPYAHIQLEQSTKAILSHFQEEDHPFIHDTLNNKNTQLVFLYFYYRPKKKAFRTDPTSDDQKAYAFAPTCVDGFTAFHRHIISVVALSYSNTLQIIFVDYAVTDTGCFDDYSDAAPCAKKIMGNGITTFLLRVAPCITFNQNIFQQH